MKHSKGKSFQSEQIGLGHSLGHLPPASEGLSLPSLLPAAAHHHRQQMKAQVAVALVSRGRPRWSFFS